MSLGPEVAAALYVGLYTERLSFLYINLSKYCPHVLQSCPKSGNYGNVSCTPRGAQVKVSQLSIVNDPRTFVQSNSIEILGN